MTSVLFLCTGNAARSVMAGVALAERRPDLVVDTAGTLCVDGMPISFRTRAALTDVSLPVPRHAGKQATLKHLHAADVVIGMAPEHVQWVRREYPPVGARTATLAYFAQRLTRADESVAARLQRLSLDDYALESWEEVVDPGGGDVAEFVACARTVVQLVQQLAAVL